MNPTPSFYSGWENQEHTCSRCGWTGLGSEAYMELFIGVTQVDCGGCGERLFTMGMPSAEQTAEAAAAGNPQAVSMFLAAHERDMFLLRRNYTLLRDGEKLPDLEGDTLDFYLTLGDNGGQVWMFLACGTGRGDNDAIDSMLDPRVLHAELARFEDTEPVGRIAGVLSSRYGDRFRYLYTKRALLYLGGDNLSAESEIRSALGLHYPSKETAEGGGGGVR